MARRQRVHAYLNLPPPLSPEAAGALRKLYRRRPTKTVKQMLATCHLPIVKFVAERAALRLPDVVDVNDLFQDGYAGLDQAIDGFDHTRGTRFSTYAAHRIRGSILDGLRRQDWVPRLVRARVGKIDHCRDDLEKSLGHPPTDDEIRTCLGMTQEQWRIEVNDARTIGVTSLNSKKYETDAGKSVHASDLIEFHGHHDAETSLDDRDLVERILQGLPPNEKFVMRSYYGGATMKETAACLGLSESRVSQIHTAIVARLRKNHTETYLRATL